MRRRFFVAEFINGMARLDGEAAHHLGDVLRAEPGQLYELSDGHTVNLAQVARVERGSVEFTIVAPVTTREPAACIALLVAIVKFDRFEWALEKSVELGAASITPVAAERSERGLIMAAPKRAERWRRILLESAQQARCLRVPVLQATTRPREAFASAGTPVERAGPRILLSERSEAIPLRQILSEKPGNTAASQSPETNPAPQPSQAAKQSAGAGVNVSLAVGPEGGWTDAEFASAAEAGFREASLGGNILRTETAVAAGLAAVHLYFDE